MAAVAQSDDLSLYAGLGCCHRILRPVNGAIEVVNGYGWVLNPRQGRIKAYVDSKSIGCAPLDGSVRAAVGPGKHMVRARLWWFLSPAVQVDVDAGQTVILKADIPRDHSLIRRMSKMARPGNSLVLSKT
jgi:hypothetical protein